MSERKTGRREMRRDRRLSEALTTNLERDSEGVFLLWRLEGGMIYSIWVKRMRLERKHSEDGPGVHARHGLSD